MAEGPTTPRGSSTPDVGGALARGWLIVLVSVVVCAAGGLVAGLNWPTEYEATSTVSLSATGSPEAPDEPVMETERLTVTSSRVLEPAGDRAGVTEASLRASVGVVVPRDSEVMEITAADRSPDLAAEKANAVAEAYAEYRAERGSETASAQRDLLRQQVKRLRTLLDVPRRPVVRDALLAEFASLKAERLAMASPEGPVTILTSASSPSTPATPPPGVFAAGGAALGLLVGVLLALLRDRSRGSRAERARGSS